MAGHKKKRPTGRQRRKRKLILFIVEILILVILLGGLFVSSKLNLINRKDLNKDKLGFNDDMDEAVKLKLEGYTNIALFGLDNRDKNNYGHGRSDVIMICSINNETKEIKMTSVYRDTFLNTAAADESPNFTKANAAYSKGGPEQAISMLNRNLDLEIKDYVTFDFTAVSEAIDVLGGVEIDLDEEELEYMRKYVDHTNGILGTDSDSQKFTHPGTYTLDGVQAVAYARIRYTSGGDFKRAERQREVFSQMMKKAKSADLSTLNKLMDEVFPDISTNLSQSRMLSMVWTLLDYDMGDSRGFPFDKIAPQKSIGSKGQVVIPCDLVSNVTQLHEFLFENDAYVPSATVQDYNYRIINETGYGAEDAITDNFNNVDEFDSSGSDTDNTTDKE